MYQVFQTKGEYEPWWLFDDWKSLVVQQHEFVDFQEALYDYKKIVKELAEKHPYYQEKNLYFSAFWNEEEIEYCESCEDDIQIYHGVMILKNDEVIEINK